MILEHCMPEYSRKIPTILIALWGDQGLYRDAICLYHAIDFRTFLPNDHLRHILSGPSCQNSEATLLECSTALIWACSPNAIPGEESFLALCRADYPSPGAVVWGSGGDERGVHPNDKRTAIAETDQKPERTMPDWHRDTIACMLSTEMGR